MRDRDDRRDSRDDDDDERREPRPKKRSVLWIVLLVVGLVVLIPVVVVVAVAVFATTHMMDDAKVNQASVQMLKIHQACKVYYTTNGKWPTSLDELIVPSKDGPALLEGGPSALINPWGQRYQFEFQRDSVGEQQLVVFANDGKGNRHQWPRK